MPLSGIMVDNASVNTTGNGITTFLKPSCPADAVRRWDPCATTIIIDP
jgi:hypothetical protein